MKKTVAPSSEKLTLTKSRLKDLTVRSGVTAGCANKSRGTGCIGLSGGGLQN